jgi:hypothetical protein
MDVLVFGAGSLGTLVGALLARVHDVTLVGRNPHVSRVSEGGARVSGAIEAHTAPAATVEYDGSAADFAVVTVKSFDTAAAAEALAAGSFDAVLSLQNGLVEDELAARLDAAASSAPASDASSSARGAAAPTPAPNGSARRSATRGSRPSSPQTCPDVCGRNSPSTRASTPSPPSRASRTGR